METKGTSEVKQHTLISQETSKSLTVASGEENAEKRWEGS